MIVRYTDFAEKASKQSSERDYVYEGSELEKQSNSENEGTEHVT